MNDRIRVLAYLFAGENLEILLFGKTVAQFVLNQNFKNKRHKFIALSNKEVSSFIVWTYIQGYPKKDAAFGAAMLINAWLMEEIDGDERRFRKITH